MKFVQMDSLESGVQREFVKNQTTSSPAGRPGAARELLQNASLAWRLLLDPHVSVLAKLIPVGVLAYVVMPFDLIPDVIPVLGQLDDLAVILLGIRLLIALYPPDRVRLHREGQMPAADPTAADDSTIDGSYRIVDD